MSGMAYRAPHGRRARLGGPFSPRATRHTYNPLIHGEPLGPQLRHALRPMRNPVVPRGRRHGRSLSRPRHAPPTHRRNHDPNQADLLRRSTQNSQGARRSSRQEGRDRREPNGPYRRHIWPRAGNRAAPGSGHGRSRAYVDDNVIADDQLRAIECLEHDVELRRSGKRTAGAVRAGQESLEERKRIILRVLRHVDIPLVVRNEHQAGALVSPLEARLPGGLWNRFRFERQHPVIGAGTGVDIVQKLERVVVQVGRCRAVPKLTAGIPEPTNRFPGLSGSSAERSGAAFTL